MRRLGRGICPRGRRLRANSIQRKLLVVGSRFGAWLSLARAPGSGPGGRWFESTRPDQKISYLEALVLARKGSKNEFALFVQLRATELAVPGGHLPEPRHWLPFIHMEACRWACGDKTRPFMCYTALSRE